LRRRRRRLEEEVEDDDNLQELNVTGRLAEDCVEEEPRPLVLDREQPPNGKSFVKSIFER